MKAPVIVDTNVVVAGLISAASDSPVCRILDGMVAGAFPFLLSRELLAEYRQVLLRPKIARLHGLSPEQIDVVLTEIVANALLRQPGLSPDAPDRGDDHLWRLLSTARGGVLVTGDQRLIDNPPASASVLSPWAWVEAPSG